jgi:hypothetical protein
MSLFAPELRIPKIYAYTTARDAATPWRSGAGTGLIKVGYTTQDVSTRILEHFGAASPDNSDFRILGQWPAITADGKMMTDRNVHDVLEFGLRKTRVCGEWFECTIEEVEQAIESLRTGTAPVADRPHSFKMRPEQSVAVERTSAYFRTNAYMRRDGPLRFLWNAKMRFGKTFTAYKLAEEMGWSRVLVLTYKPAVEGEWRRDLTQHVDFRGWSFIGNQDKAPTVLPEKTVWFSSFQSIFAMDHDAPHRLDLLKSTHWDAIILDEYHFGAGTDLAREIYADSSELMDDEAFQRRILSGEAGVTADHLLHLSGTPFRALNSGEFGEDQVFSWTYTDEQRAKRRWLDADGPNPYESLPQMIMMAYKLPPGVIDEATEEELNLDLFFSAKKEKDQNGEEVFYFNNEKLVLLWLDFITGVDLSREEFSEEQVNKSPMPFRDEALYSYLNHTFWYLPSVAACKAMARLISSHSVLHHYKPVIAAGPEARIGADALQPVQDAIRDNPRTITLSCGKLTTGVTVPEWTAVFMLRSMKSPESYFQTAFRAQSPGLVFNRPKQRRGSEALVMKDRCFLFDFDPRRALSLAADYCYRLDAGDVGGRGLRMTMEERMAEFLNHMPVLLHDGGTMEQLNPGDAIDIVSSGVGNLAKRFLSARALGLDGLPLDRLVGNEQLMSNLEEIESFRNLRETVTGLSADRDWWVMEGAKREGPLKRSALRDRVDEDTLVKCRGMSDYEPAGRVPALNAIFAQRYEWFIRTEEGERGPFRKSELADRIRSDTLVRRSDDLTHRRAEFSVDFCRADKDPELKSLFKDASRSTLKEEWHYKVGEAVFGPMDIPSLKAEIARTTLVRKTGMTDFAEAGTFEELLPLGPISAKQKKELQENLLKFISRLPVFMYLNDEREKSVVDVIRSTDDRLFRRVTGITKKDFDQLFKIGIFVESFLNPPILAFKQLEDRALEYLGDRDLGISRFTGAFNSVVEKEDVR